MTMIIFCLLITSCDRDRYLTITKKDERLWTNLIENSVETCSYSGIKKEGQKALEVQEKWKVRRRFIDVINNAKIEAEGDTLIIEEDYSGDPPTNYTIRLKQNNSFKILGYTVDKNFGQGTDFEDFDSTGLMSRWSDYLDTLDIHRKIYPCQLGIFEKRFLIEIRK